MNWNNDPKRGNESEAHRRCKEYLQDHVFNTAEEWLRSMIECDSHGIRQDLRNTPNGQWREMPSDYFYSNPLLPRWEKNKLAIKSRGGKVKGDDEKKGQKGQKDQKGLKRQRENETSGDENRKSKRQRKRERRAAWSAKRESEGGSKNNNNKNNNNSRRQNGANAKGRARKRCKDLRDGCWHHRQDFGCSFWHPSNPGKECFAGKNCTRTNCPFEHSPEEQDLRSRGGGGGRQTHPFQNQSSGRDFKSNPSANVYRIPTKSESANAMAALEASRLAPNAFNYSHEVHRQRQAAQVHAAVANATPAQIQQSLYALTGTVPNTAAATNSGNAAPQNALSFNTGNGRLNQPSAVVLPGSQPQSNPWHGSN
jgi:hypothetical protein